MFKKSLLLCFIFSICAIQTFGWSPKAKASLITVSPGDELYSGFGHSAIWIFDPEMGIDNVYNYGTFDFDTPGFYTKFVQGKLPYMLSVSEIKYLMYGAQYEGRSVIEQELNLTEHQLNRLYTFLENNYLPENRFYKYDFFFDNCSSRLRDALQHVFADSLQFNLKEEKPLSFRQLIDPYLRDKQLQDLGMDIGLGSPADRIATPYDYMFLPDHLLAGFDSGLILTADGNQVPLVKTKSLIFDANYQASVTPFYLTPLFFTSIIFLLGLVLTFVNRKKVPKRYFADSFFFLVLGLLGCLLVFLWFGTDHKVTINNFNLIWAFPMHIIASVVLINRSRTKAWNLYFLITAIVTLLFIVSIPIIPQEINIAVLPLLLLLALRSFVIYYKSGKAL
ncbi:MAG: DUF4105 domain-containing protein [Cytophagaceae bacterium]